MDTVSYQFFRTKGAPTAETSEFIVSKMASKSINEMKETKEAYSEDTTSCHSQQKSRRGGYEKVGNMKCDIGNSAYLR
jgi:hypothetical protein